VRVGSFALEENAMIFFKTLTTLSLAAEDKYFYICFRLKINIFG
jgi:hypothetical protein